MFILQKRQAGGTLLGLILGLVLGLAIAVVAAIMIKNTPLPFTNKLGRPDKLPEVQSKGQITDPNRSLQGNRDAVGEAARNTAMPATSRTPVDPVDSAAEAARAANRDSSFKPPIIDRSTGADTRVAKVEPSSAADEKFTYYLQAGAFLEQADAENTRAKLALMGVGANIVERKGDNNTLYRVRIGPFAQLEAMNRVRGKLTDNGVDVAVVRVPK